MTRGEFEQKVTELLPLRGEGKNAVLAFPKGAFGRGVKAENHFTKEELDFFYSVIQTDYVRLTAALAAARRERDKLKSMIDHGLGWEDITRDTYPI